MNKKLSVPQQIAYCSESMIACLPPRTSATANWGYAGCPKAWQKLVKTMKSISDRIEFFFSYVTNVLSDCSYEDMEALLGQNRQYPAQRYFA